MAPSSTFFMESLSIAISSAGPISIIRTYNKTMPSTGAGMLLIKPTANGEKARAIKITAAGIMATFDATLVVEIIPMLRL